jgi:signal transduction histidine kinase
MLVRFRNLSLTAKLLLIGIIPILFLIYFSLVIYREKARKVELLGDYIEHVDQSANIGELISELTRERRYSYLYTIKDTDKEINHRQILEHRQKVDSVIRILKKSDDLALRDFTKYTFLDNLAATRAAIDTVKQFRPDAVIQYYTDAIFRINTLKSAIPGNTFLKPVYQDLLAQKTLSEMITYLGILRTNIFNVLYTKKYVVETLFGTLGVHKVFNTYETEFLLKASPASVKFYEDQKRATALKPTLDYLDKVFSTFKIDSSYNADQWWDLSTKAMIVLRTQQRDLWKKVDIGMKQIYQNEIESKNLALLLMVISILSVILFVAYVVRHINRLLNEIKTAADKISKGETGLQLKNMPEGIIGNLAERISDIDKNNLVLAEAASQIGKGNFDVVVKPRSDKDLLGISIKKMQQDLQQYASQKDKIQKETEDLVYRRDEFFSIASHELKTPVTSLKAYTQLLLMDAEGGGDSQQKNMLQRMDIQINKLTSLINDLLDTSKIENGHLVYNKEVFSLKDLVKETIAHLKPASLDNELIFQNSADANINADRDRIGQVLNNFLTNAMKYAPDGKKIIIALNREDGKVICSVQDFGKGIVAEEQEKIFERFYRITGHNLNTFPGLGLGLFICKEIIEKHGGKIGLISERGKGSTFYFELPVVHEG